jgi:hypothetical protein
MQNILKFATLYKNAVSAGGKNLSKNFWVQFVQTAQRLGVNPQDLAVILWKESAFNPAAGNPHGAKGLNQLIKTTAKSLGMTDATWQQYLNFSAEDQLPWVEKYFQRANVSGKSAYDLYKLNLGGYRNPDGSFYAGKAAQEAFKKEHPEAVFQRSEHQQKAIEQNPGLVDDSGRITPATLKKFIGKGLPSWIGSEIEEALLMIGDKIPPPTPNPKQAEGWEMQSGNAIPELDKNKPQISDSDITNLWGFIS